MEVEIAGYKESLAVKEKEATQLQAQGEKLQTELSEIKVQKEELEITIINNLKEKGEMSEAHRSEVQELTEKIQWYEGTKMQMEDELTEKLDELQELKDRYSKLEQKLAEVESNLKV